MTPSESIKADRIDPSGARYPLGLLTSYRHPPEIDTLGNLDLLSRPGLGICGSRSASAAALKHAREFGALCAEYGFVVVSGYARGVDREAHKGALLSGGATIAVLAEGISNFRLLREFDGIADYKDNFLAISVFPSDAHWTVWNADGRNRAIVGLSQGLFVIEAKERGGTLRAGEECLRQGKPLWVIDYAARKQKPEGNKLLLARAAKAIRTKRDLRGVLTSANDSSQPAARQLSLGNERV